MLQYKTLLVAGIAAAAAVMGMTWLLLSIVSYAAPPQPTLIPVGQDDDTVNTGSSANLPSVFPTLTQSEVAEQVGSAVSNSGYGMKVELVQSKKGYLTGGIAPVNSDGEGPGTMPNALLLSTTQSDVYHHRIILCGPDGICIDDGGGGGPLFASPNDKSRSNENDDKNNIGQADAEPVFYQFYPLNDVGWKLGDTVHIWMLLSYAASDGSPTGNSQWVDIGMITIEKCSIELWCPTN